MALTTTHDDITSTGETTDSSVQAANTEAALKAKWGYEHPFYDRADWKHDYWQMKTELSYWSWVLQKHEANGSAAEHCTTCGYPGNTGDAGEFSCGNCNCPDVGPAGHKWKCSCAAIAQPSTATPAELKA